MMMKFAGNMRPSTAYHGVALPESYDGAALLMMMADPLYFF